jgi:hypothetical protein
MARQGPKTEKALNDARSLLKANKSDDASRVLTAALKDAPGNPALLALQQQAAHKAQQAKLEAERRQAESARALALVAAKKRQQDLANQAAEARKKAEQEAKARSEAARAAQAAQKAKAAEALRAQAKQLAGRGDQAGAVRALQSAAALKPDDALFKELGQARAAAELAQKQKADAERQKRDEAERQRREEAAKRVAAEKASRDQAEVAKRKAQEAHDQTAYDALVKQARDFLVKKDHAHALAAAESARRLKNTDEATKLVRDARDGAALAEAERKSAAARAEAARKLEAERKQREAAQAAQQKAQLAYTAALSAGQKALSERRYDAAVAQYQAAAKLFRTDAALAGLKQAEELRAQEKALAEQARQQKAAEAQKAARIKDLLGQGQKALQAKRYDQAITAYRGVTALQPGHAEALAGLSRAEREREAALAKAKPPAVDPRAKKQKEDYELAMSAGQAAVKKNNLEGARNAYREALRIMPGDPKATQALGSVEALLKQAQDAAAKKKDAAYATAMNQGQAALKARRWADAFKAFDQALQLRPGDAAAIRGKTEAQNGMKALPPPPPPDPNLKQQAAFNGYMAQGQAALQAKRYADAVKAFTEALKVKPNDPTALRGKAQAEQAMKAPATPPKPPAPMPTAQQEYARLMAAGAALEKQKKWAEAVAAYTAALGKMPGDAKATAALRGAAYQQHMAAGQAAHAQKKFADAVKSYTEALKLMPTSAEAKQALEKAKAGKP